MILSDPLHVLYLGIARDFVGSAVKLLVLHGQFPGSSWEVRMQSAFQAFRLAAKPSTVSIINFGIKQPPKYETVHGKASDVKLMIVWIADVSHQFMGQHADILRAAAYCLAELGSCVCDMLLMTWVLMFALKLVLF